MPSPISCWNAGMPSTVPGTLIITLGRFDRLPQAASFRKRAFGLVRQIGRDFEAHVAIPVFRALVYGQEYIGGVLNVANGQGFIARLGVEIFFASWAFRKSS